MLTTARSLIPCSRSRAPLVRTAVTGLLNQSFWDPRQMMTGIDPADDATVKSEGRFETDYTQYLDAVVRLSRPPEAVPRQV